MNFLCIERGINLDESIFHKKVKNKSEDCLNKKLKCQLRGKYFTKKWLATHSELGHHQNKSNSKFLKQPKIGKVPNNKKRTLILGLVFQIKTILCLKFIHKYPIEIFI